MSAITLTHCTAEIQRLHDFFQAWFTGTIPESDESFQDFTRVMDPNFAIIGPNGVMTTLPALTTGLRTAYGKQPDIRIWTQNHRFHQQWGEIMLCTYEEWQESTKETTARLSSVLFRRDDAAPHQLCWCHVHETWLETQ